MDDQGKSGRLIMRLPQVTARTGLSRSSIYSFMRGPERFPQAVPLGVRAVGWVNHEVDAWVSDRISARSSRSAA